MPIYLLIWDIFHLHVVYKSDILTMFCIGISISNAEAQKENKRIETSSTHLEHSAPWEKRQIII
jgi:hypothetical protein